MILSLKNIALSRGHSSILSGVSIDVPRGAFFVLMGPTGCGKTTLLRVAGLLDRPSSGELFFNGVHVPVRGRELVRHRRRIATVFQTPVMFRGTVRANIEWGLKVRGIKGREADSRISETLDLTGLQGLENRDASTLSGGEMRRTALARAMVLEPELLILDEPTTWLDTSFKGDFLKRIKMIHEKRETTILMATHDFTDALSVGSAGAVMRSGTIEQSGSIDELLFKPDSHFMASFTGIKNTFPAEFKGAQAKLGTLWISHSGEMSGHGFLAIPPEVIVLSRRSGVTSERNRFQGVVKTVHRNGTNWEVGVEVKDSGVTFVAALTTGALDELDITPSADVFVSFKASAVHLF